MAAGQDVMTVKGIVKDAIGPVIGATVIEKGSTTNGTVTDVDGSFSIEVPSGASIEIICIGYKTVEFTAGSVPAEIIL